MSRAAAPSSASSSSFALSETVPLQRKIGPDGLLPSGGLPKYGTVSSIDDESLLAGVSPPSASGRWTIVTTPSMLPQVPGQGCDLHMPKQQEGNVDFHDWVEDSKWTYIDHDKAIREVRGTVLEYWYRSQGWFAVLAIGLAVGTIGAMVHISTLWVHGLTRGYCTEAWYLSPIHCEMYPGAFRHYPHLFGVSAADQPVLYAHIGSAFYVVVSCLLTCTSAWVVTRVSKQAAGAGVPEIKAILGGAEVGGFSSVKTGLTKWVGLVGAVGGSLSIGKAAPLMHIAFCIGAAVANMFEKYRNSMGKMREMLTCATAAGVCVAFGAPLGGVLYAFEETSSFFSAQTLYRSFLCSVVAAATLQFWDPFMSDKLTLFSINYHVAWDLWELPLFALLGILGGATGQAFNSIHLRVARWRKQYRSSLSPIKEVLIVTLLTTLLEIVFLPSGFHRTDAETLKMLFSHCDWGASGESAAELDHCKMTPDSALTLGVLKFFLTALSFGMMVPAGLFMPNLVIGACLGWYLGLTFDKFIEINPFDIKFFTLCHANDMTCVVPAVYSIVGAAAVMGGINRMTLSLVTIMFELTGGFEYIIPITVGVMCSKWTSELLGGKNSIYNLLLDHKGLPFLDPRFEGRHDVTSNAPICEVIDLNPSRVRVIYERQTVQETLDLLAADVPGYAVIKHDLDMKVLGYMSKRQLTIALEDLDDELQSMNSVAQGDVPIMFVPGTELSPETPFSFRQRTPGLHMHTPGLGQTVKYAYDLHGYVDTSPVTVRPDCEVARVSLLFRRLGLNSILVTDSQNCLQGVVTKKALIDHLNKDYEVQDQRAALGQCPGGQGTTGGSMSQLGHPFDYPKGGFHQSELEAEHGHGNVLAELPALPPGAQIMRKKTRRRSSRY